MPACAAFAAKRPFVDFSVARAIHLLGEFFGDPPLIKPRPVAARPTPMSAPVRPATALPMAPLMNELPTREPNDPPLGKLLRERLGILFKGHTQKNA